MSLYMLSLCLSSANAADTSLGARFKLNAALLQNRVTQPVEDGARSGDPVASERFGVYATLPRLEASVLFGEHLEAGLLFGYAGQHLVLGDTEGDPQQWLEFGAFATGSLRFSKWGAAFLQPMVLRRVESVVIPDVSRARRGTWEGGGAIGTRLRLTDHLTFDPAVEVLFGSGKKVSGAGDAIPGELVRDRTLQYGLNAGFSIWF